MSKIFTNFRLWVLKFNLGVYSDLIFGFEISGKFWVFLVRILDFDLGKFSGLFIVFFIGVLTLLFSDFFCLYCSSSVYLDEIRIYEHNIPNLLQHCRIATEGSATIVSKFISKGADFYIPIIIMSFYLFSEPCYYNL